MSVNKEFEIRANELGKTIYKLRYHEQIQILRKLIKKDDFFIKLITIITYLLIQSLYILIDLSLCSL